MVRPSAVRASRRSSSGGLSSRILASRGESLEEETRANEEQIPVRSRVRAWKKGLPECGISEIAEHSKAGQATIGCFRPGVVLLGTGCASGIGSNRLRSGVTDERSRMEALASGLTCSFPWARQADITKGGRGDMDERQVPSQPPLERQKGTQRATGLAQQVYKFLKVNHKKISSTRQEEQSPVVARQPRVYVPSWVLFSGRPTEYK